MTNSRELKRRQIDRQLQAAGPRVALPKSGWIKAIREGLGMTLTQMAARMGVAKSVASDFERREREGRVTLNTLKKAADALECDLVYGLQPREGTLLATVQKRAHAIALARVSHTSHSMDLEAQNTTERFEEAVDDVVRELLSTDIRVLWDETP